MVGQLFVYWMMLLSTLSVIARPLHDNGVPEVQVGINLPVYPELAPVPGYPVYYAPQINSNYFFYDGMYWIYQEDRWFTSAWYNGPWRWVSPHNVPAYILRIPVRFYQQPPPYFAEWPSSQAPHWGEHWGSEWSQRRRGWDHWNPNAAPPPAPLPSYQQNYAGSQYPAAAQRRKLHRHNYHYKPRNLILRRPIEAVPTKPATAPRAAPSRPPPPVAQPQPNLTQLPSPAPAPVPRHTGRPAEPAKRPPAPMAAPRWLPQEAARRPAAGTAQPADHGAGQRQTAPSIEHGAAKDGAPPLQTPSRKTQDGREVN